MNFGEKKEMAKKKGGFFIYFPFRMLEICQNRIISSREGWSTAQRLYSRQEVDKRHREKKFSPNPRQSSRPGSEDQISKKNVRQQLS